eukprot:199065_1
MYINSLKNNVETSKTNSVKHSIIQRIGCCTLNECVVLQLHRMRRREDESNREHRDNRVEHDSSLNEIISSTLYGLHCYFQHQKHHLFRLERSDNNLHFITP